MPALRLYRSNIWKLSFYKFLSEFWVIAPVLIPYYQSAGLSSTQVFVIQSFYVTLAAVLEIPSGYFADVIGRRTALIAGAILMPAGLLFYALSNSFWGFMAAEGILAVSASLRSGTDTALLYDTLIQLKASDHFKKSIGRVEMAARAGGALAAVFGSFLGLFFIRLPFLINMVTGAAMIVIGFRIIEPKREKESGAHPLRGILRTIRAMFTRAQIPPVLGYWSLLFSVGITGYWAYILYYQSLKVHPAMFGVCVALFLLASGFGSIQSHRIEKKIGFRTSLLLTVIIGASFFALGIFRSRLAIPLVFANGFLWGLAGPILMHDLNAHTPSRVRATVVSVCNMAGGIAFAVFSTVFGKITDKAGLPAAMIMTGVFFTLAGGLVLRSILRSRSAEGGIP